MVTVMVGMAKQRAPGHLVNEVGALSEPLTPLRPVATGNVDQRFDYGRSAER